MKNVLPIFQMITKVTKVATSSKEEKLEKGEAFNLSKWLKDSLKLSSTILSELQKDIIKSPNSGIDSAIRVLKHLQTTDDDVVNHKLINKNETLIKNATTTTSKLFDVSENEIY